MNRKRYKEEDYIRKCIACKHHRPTNFMNGHACDMGLITRNRYDYKVYNSCPDYVPIKKSALRGESPLGGIFPEKIYIPTELLPFHNEYISKRDSGYCDTHNCKLCSLNEYCRVDCYEDVVIDLDTCELSNLANIHSMLESICNKRFNDCKICPLSRTGEKSDCYVYKFLNSNIQALDEIYNDRRGLENDC